MAEKEDTKIVAYKGFNKDWTCTGGKEPFQYEVGGSYVHEGEVKACESGFHVCEYPLDVFKYYNPCSSNFALVSLSGDLSKEESDSKVAGRNLEIVEELSITDLIKLSIDFTTSKAKFYKKSHVEKENGAASSTGYYGAASSTGNYGAASSTGNYGAASSTGTRGAASSTGNYGAASSTGNYGAASSTGHCGAASSTGNYGAASSTGNYGAASSTGTRGAASSTGNYGAASSTGNYGAASSTGNYGAASSTGTRGAASSTGYRGKVLGKSGNALFLTERNEKYEIINVWAGIVGKDGILEDTWYTLTNGIPTIVEN
jgi:hypothetical protein